MYVTAHFSQNMRSNIWSLGLLVAADGLIIGGTAPSFRYLAALILLTFLPA